MTEWKYYCGKERAFLRKRRTRMQLTHFHILSQIGQGGYGKVYIAQKKDTQEICALKKMSKSLLHQLGEIQHILTERDILTRSDSPWLVKLLYAFQDSQNVYLAMVKSFVSHQLKLIGICSRRRYANITE